ncbi:MAG: SRPBCC domain-containing protein [Bacteroidales bacterium]|nr:SRPBCC domain-containing protein [Bacteroidales bacterium]
MTKSSNPIIVEQHFAISVKEVWSAITELEQMRLWFFESIPSFEPVLGFQTKFKVQSESRTFTHIWKIVEVEPYKKIKYDWCYAEYQGKGLVTFELYEKGEQTMLRLTNEGLQTFPQHIPEFAQESCRGGWEFFIKQNLKNYLEQKNRI